VPLASSEAPHLRAVATGLKKGATISSTEADRQAEALIADILVRAVPESRVVGEELSPARCDRARSCGS